MAKAHTLSAFFVGQLTSCATGLAIPHCCPLLNDGLPIGVVQLEISGRAVLPCPARQPGLMLLLVYYRWRLAPVRLVCC